MLAVSLIVGTFFVLLLVAENTPLVGQSAAWIPLVLILSAILSLTLSSRLLADRSNVRMVELELARSVSVHSATGQAPEADSHLGSVLQEYVRAADEMRRHWRTDAYAAGPAMWGASLALFAAILWGLSFSTGVVWINYLAIVVELPVVMMLFFSLTVLATGVGQDRTVPGFEALTPRRWRTFNDHTPAVDQAISEIPWLEEFARGLRGENGTPGSQPAGLPVSTPSST